MSGVLIFEFEVIDEGFAVRTIDGPVRFGIVGTGKIAKKHALALKALGGEVVLAGVTDMKVEKAEAFGREYGFGRVYGDVGAMLEGVDAVAICTPPRTHGELIGRVLRAGRAALCEKPVVGSLRELDELLALERELAGKGGAVGCVFQWRYGRGLGMLLELMKEGKTGRLLWCSLAVQWYRTMEYYHNPWRGSFEHETGGVSVTQGIHGIDAVLAVAGPAKRVTAQMATLNHKIEVEDYCQALVEFGSGALGTMQFTVDCAEQRSQMVFGFENLTALSNDTYSNSADSPWKWVATERGGKGLQAELDGRAVEWGARAGGSNHTAQFAGFVREIKAGQRPAVGLAECRGSAEMISGMYKSAKEGRGAELPILEGDLDYGDWSGGRRGKAEG